MELEFFGQQYTAFIGFLLTLLSGIYLKTWLFDFSLSLHCQGFKSCIKLWLKLRLFSDGGVVRSRRVASKGRPPVLPYQWGNGEWNDVCPRSSQTEWVQIKNNSESSHVKTASRVPQIMFTALAEMCVFTTHLIQLEVFTTQIFWKWQHANIHRHPCKFFYIFIYLFLMKTRYKQILLYTE